MSPFEDFDLDLLKIQNMGGITPLDASEDGNPSSSGSGSSSSSSSQLPDSAICLSGSCLICATESCLYKCE